MRMRCIQGLLTILVLAAAPAALAGHHESKGKAGAKGHEKAMKQAGDARDAAEQQAEDARVKAEKGADESAARGAELRDRRDERKAIMDEAKTAAEPGTPRKGKKSWWRFWESEAADAPE
ncbi:MAG: hypothetical protein ACYTG6_17860 [Planctomycetota bacterium]|jgi:hypothetical protein